MKITYRERQPKDDLPLSHLYLQIRSDEFPWEQKVMVGDYYRHTKGEEIIVAEVDGVPAGFISVWKLGRFVHCLYVDRAYRRLGIGKALLEEAGRRWGYPLTLKCMKENRGALRLYHRLGFVVTDETRMQKGDCLELTKERRADPECMTDPEGAERAAKAEHVARAKRAVREEDAVREEHASREEHAAREEHAGREERTGIEEHAAREEHAGREEQAGRAEVPGDSKRRVSRFVGDLRERIFHIMHS